MKIVHVEDYFDPTAGYQINELLYASKNFGDDVFLITSSDMTPFHKTVDLTKDIEYEKETGVKIIRLDPLVKISSRLILKKLNKTIKSINPDVVFMHGIGDFKDLQLWKNKPEYKIIRDCHMSWVASKNRFNKFFYKIFSVFFAPIINNSSKYEVVYALGDEEYEYLRRIGIKDSKIDYLKHGYNDSVMFFNENDREITRNRYGFKKSDIVISYIGKFNEAKRPDLIIDIVEKLDKKYENINLMFIGPKNEKYMIFFNEKLERINDEFNIVIDDTKPFNELRKYYAASDICIFPRETTLSSIHAQVCGCPVIMEKHKSNTERVINNSNLFAINDLSDAASILKRIIDNDEYIKTNNFNTIDLLSDREYKNQVMKLRQLANGHS